MRRLLLAAGLCFVTSAGFGCSQNRGDRFSLSNGCGTRCDRVSSRNCNRCERVANCPNRCDKVAFSPCGTCKAKKVAFRGCDRCERVSSHGCNRCNRVVEGYDRDPVRVYGATTSEPRYDTLPNVNSYETGYTAHEIAVHPNTNDGRDPNYRTQTNTYTFEPIGTSNTTHRVETVNQRP